MQKFLPGNSGNAPGRSKSGTAGSTPPPSAILSSRGSSMTTPDNSADNDLIVTLTLDQPDEGAIWSITANPSGFYKIVGSPGTSIEVRHDGARTSGDQGVTTLTVAVAEYGLEETYSIEVIDSGAASIQSMLVTNSSGSIASGPVIFGIVPAPGSIDGSTQRFAGSGTTVQEDNRATDRSGNLRFATGCAWVTDVPANGTSVFTIIAETGSPSTGATKSISDLLTAAGDWDFALSLTERGGSTYTLSLREVLSTGTSTYSQGGYTVRARKWRDGPVCKAYVIHASPRTAGATPHPLLFTTAVVEFFSGDNFSTVSYVRSQARTSNSWLEDAGIKDVICSGSWTRGVSSPTTIADWTVEDLSAQTLTVVKSSETNRYSLVTRASGEWSADIQGQYIYDDIVGWKGQIMERISNTVVKVRVNIGTETPGNLDNAEIWPLPIFTRHSLVNEDWWPSAPPLSVQHSYTEIRDAKVWPRGSYDGTFPIETIQSILTEESGNGTNPFHYGAQNFISREPQDAQTEAREIPTATRALLYCNDGGYHPVAMYDLIKELGRQSLALRKLSIDANKGVPPSIIDIPNNDDEDLISGANDLGVVSNCPPSHSDQHFYIPYILFGDFWYLYAISQDFYYYWQWLRNFGNGMDRSSLDCLNRVIRGRLWGDRTMAMHAFMLPDDVGDLFAFTKANARTFADNNFAKLTEKYVDDGTGNTGWFTGTNTTGYPLGASPVSNFTAPDDPCYIQHSGTRIHFWQQLGFWPRVSLLRHELGETNADSQAFYRRLHESLIWCVTHPDIDAKGGTLDENRERLFGSGTTYSASTAGEVVDWSGIWDALSSSQNAGYSSRHLAAMQIAAELGYYTNSTKINDTYDWAVSYCGGKGWVTTSGGDLDRTTFSSWNSNFQTETYVRRS